MFEIFRVHYGGTLHYIKFDFSFTLSNLFQYHWRDTDNEKEVDVGPMFETSARNNDFFFLIKILSRIFLLNFLNWD